MRPRPPAKTLQAVFRPRSVAVVGASSRPGAIGYQVIANLLAGGFTGPIYPVNDRTKVAHSMATYSSVGRIPGPVDLAILAIPADAVLRTAEACGKKGVGALVVITAGFREVGGEGIEREQKLLRIAAKYGMRVVGPNCMGVINTEPAFALNGSFAATLPQPGPVAMVSQSGALGEAILADAAAAGLGVSMFASVGNHCDVTADQLIEYWEDDPAVRVILLYIESFGDPEHFVQVARRVSRKKPILAVKAGRSAQGAAAASSHTGSVAGADAAADSMLTQCGVLRVTSFRQMFALAAALLHQPTPTGPNVAVVTNAGGPGILATDALVGCGLEMAEFTAKTSRALEKALPPEASSHNPVDLIASADAARYRKALRAVTADPRVDVLMVLFVSPVMIDAVAVAEAIVEETQGKGKTVLACLMGRQRGSEAMQLLKDHGIPVYRYPEDAAVTVRQMVRRGAMQARKPGSVPTFKVQKVKVQRLLARAPGGWLSAEQAEQVLAAYGIPFAPSRLLAADPGAAVAAGHALGFPVVLKAEAEAMLHKSEFGAVCPGLEDGDQLFAAAQQLQKRLGRRFKDLQFRVQSQARGKREMLVGMTRDPRYGPLFALGLGGTEVEVLRDVSLRVGPLDRQAPDEMLDDLKGAPLLGAFRGKPASDRRAAGEALLRLQQLVRDHPRVAEVEINPFILGTPGAKGVPSYAVDARLRLADA